jgi:hypothetical protein
MHPILNTVMFAGPGGLMFTEKSVDQHVYPQSVPANDTVVLAFRNGTKPECACYQPTLGYYFLINAQQSGEYYEVWAYDSVTPGWWRWSLAGVNVTMVTDGPDQKVFFGSKDGKILELMNGLHGYDLDEQKSGGMRYSSGFTLQSIDANSTRDKFFEWFYIDYLPLGPAGQMWLDYREGRGYTYKYTSSALSGSEENALTVGWDTPISQWDKDGIAWDAGRTVEKANRVNRRSNTQQVSVYSNVAVRIVGLAINGGMIARKARGWSKR